MQRDDVVTDASSIAQPLDAFETFVQEAELRLRRALIARFGTEVGRDATAEAIQTARSCRSPGRARNGILNGVFAVFVAAAAAQVAVIFANPRGARPVD